MALILYAYSVSSIRAAKRNAQLHREADGGQLDMRKESLRRHGVLEKVEGTTGYKLFRSAGKDVKNESEHMGGNEARKLGEEDGRGHGRTRVEGDLEGLKGRRGSQEIVQRVLAQERAEKERAERAAQEE